MSPSAVAAAMKLIRRDRPRWTITPELIGDWEDEFGHLEPPILAEAAKHLRRTQPGTPTIKGFHDAIAFVRGLQERRLELEEWVPEEPTTEQVARIQQKHPWYAPAATMEENLSRCQAYRGTIPWAHGAFARPFREEKT